MAMGYLLMNITNSSMTEGCSLMNITSSFMFAKNYNNLTLFVTMAEFTKDIFDLLR